MIWFFVKKYTTSKATLKNHISDECIPSAPNSFDELHRYLFD